MATERIVNVPIHFKINTVEVERYESLLKRADQAAANLGQTSNRAASQSAAGFKSTGSSIAAMRTDLDRLKSQIEATGKADTKRLQQLSTQYKALSAEIQKQTKLYLEQGRAIKQSAASTKDLASQFGQLYSAARSFVTAGVVTEIISMQLNMAKLSGQVEGVQRAFQLLPGAGLLLEDLRRATRGTVTDLELMQKALMAQNYRIPLKNLGTLLEFAAVRAQQTGQEVNHLVDYIVTGIGLRSIKRLDDLGFTANRVKEALGGVSLQAASMGQVMTAVSKLMNEDLQKTGGFIETAKTEVEKLQTSIHELNVEVANRTTSSGLIGWFNDVVTVTRQAIKAGFEYKDLLILLANPQEFAQRRVAMAAEVAIQEEAEKLAADQVLSFQRQNALLDERQRLLAAENELFDVAKTIEQYQTLDATEQARVENLKVEIEQLKERNKSMIGLQKTLSEEAKLIKEKEKEIDSIIKNTEARKNNKKVLEEVVKLLIDYRDTVRQIDEAAPEGDDPGDIVTDPVAFFPLGKKKPIIPMDSYRDQIVKSLQESIDRLRESEIPIVPVQTKPIILQDEWEKAFEENRAAIADLAFNTVNEQVNSLLMADVEGYNARIDAARSFYDEQIELAGDNERRKQELRIKEQREIVELEKQRADREKKAATAGIIVSTALGIMRVFTEPSLTFADKIIKAAIVAAEGASQYAIASRARYYAKGGLAIDGPGTKTSDSIPAFLSKGESVMTADETGSSMNILKSIRAKKLNDKVLKDLMSGRSGGAAAGIFDDSKILKKLDEVKNSQPDIEMRAGLVYKGYKSGENYVKWIRSKSMGR